MVKLDSFENGHFHLQFILHKGETNTPQSLRDPRAPAWPGWPQSKALIPIFLISSLGKEYQLKAGGPSFDLSQEPSALAPLPRVWGKNQLHRAWISPGPGCESLYAMCALCKLIFLLAATKIKDLAIYCKRHFQFYVVAFLSYDQGINPAFSLCL